MSAPGVPGSTLGRFVRQASPKPDPAEVGAVEESCELCGEPIPPAHRHVLDLGSRALLCACRACATLFDRAEAGGGHYRLMPDRVWLVEDFELDDALWERFQIPVGLAFFYDDTRAGRVVAYYPSPMGATESSLELDTWTELETNNPVLEAMQPDVEALLVDRTGQDPRHWLVPLETCYSLVGLIRLRWKGLSGGREVWDAIKGFFDELESKATRVNRQGDRVTA